GADGFLEWPYLWQRPVRRGSAKQRERSHDIAGRHQLDTARDPRQRMVFCGLWQRRFRGISVNRNKSNNDIAGWNYMDSAFASTEQFLVRAYLRQRFVCRGVE